MIPNTNFKGFLFFSFLTQTAAKDAAAKDVKDKGNLCSLEK